MTSTLFEKLKKSTVKSFIFMGTKFHGFVKTYKKQARFSWISRLHICLLVLYIFIDTYICVIVMQNLSNFINKEFLSHFFVKPNQLHFSVVPVRKARVNGPSTNILATSSHGMTRKITKLQTTFLESVVDDASSNRKVHKGGYSNKNLQENYLTQSNQFPQSNIIY